MENRAKKTLWHSVAPWCGTGYGQQTAIFAPKIAALDDRDLAISAYWGLNDSKLEWNGITVYPGENMHSLYLPMWVDRHGAGGRVQVITLMDVWPPQFREVIKGLDADVACWAPVDHKPCPPRVAEFFHQTGARPIAMSRFGEAELRQAGLDPLYVPHGVDTKIFRPYDRADIRSAYDMPDDAFIVGMVAGNNGNAPSRKAFPEALIAFSEFRRNHTDAMLYLHTELTGSKLHGVNLPPLFDEFEIPPESVRFTHQGMLAEGIAAEVMGPLYACFDVLLNPSYGEGFGIPIVEAQACGTPVIVTDWTSMTELCGAGWLVSGEPRRDNQQAAFYMPPAVGDIVDKLEQAYEHAAGLREQAREFALAYDADRVFAEHWLPTLAALDAPREVGPLLPNRAMRRRAAKRKVTA